MHGVCLCVVVRVVKFMCISYTQKHKHTTICIHTHTHTLRSVVVIGGGGCGGGDVEKSPSWQASMMMIDKEDLEESLFEFTELYAARHIRGFHTLLLARLPIFVVVIHALHIAALAKVVAILNFNLGLEPASLPAIVREAALKTAVILHVKLDIRVPSRLQHIELIRPLDRVHRLVKSTAGKEC